jgi:hypothetical protein
MGFEKTTIIDENLLPPLSEEEIKNRQKEWDNLENKNLLDEIRGERSKKVNFGFLLHFTQNYIDTVDEDELEIEESFLSFMLWIRTEKSFYSHYENNINILEEIFNEGLGKFGDDNIFSYMDEKISSLFLKKWENAPLTGLETEVSERLKILWETDKNLENIFKKIELYKGYSWDEFVNDVLK